MPLETYAYGTTFDEPWEYDYVVVMLMYPSRNTRPVIQFLVNHCDRFTHNTRRIHDETVKSICRYLVVIKGKGLNFYPDSDMNLD